MHYMNDPVTQVSSDSTVNSGIYPPRTYLFLDDFYIAGMQGTRRVTNRPVHAADGPVLRAERPWEGISVIGRNGILYDKEERCFKCWYPCHDGTLPDTPVLAKRRWAYATSSDGIHWDRPSLGLSEFAGTTDNNLVRFENVDETVGLLWNVVKDNDEPDPTKRYKSIGLDRHALRPGESTWTGPDGEDAWYERMGRHIGCGLFIGYSPDGLRWRLREGSAASGALIMDGSMLHGYDQRIRQWVLWQRPRILPKYRTFGISFSKDFENWTFPEFGLTPDAQDPPEIQFDTFSSIASPDGGYIGLLSASGFVLDDWAVGGLRVQLVYSRDGKVWTRVDRQPLILPQRPSPTWDEGTITAFNPILVGDEIFIFYYGKNHGHLWGQPTFDGKGVTSSAYGLTKLKRDRWVAVADEPSRGGGELQTTLVCFANNQLHLNANVSEGGLITVELRDRVTGQPVPGFAMSDCDPIRGDSLDHLVTWRGKSDLSELIGTGRRQPRVGRGLDLRFHLDRASLYSFSC